MVSQSTHSEDDRLAYVLGFPLREKRTELDDTEAFSLLNHYAASGQWGRDPIHLILEKAWFTNIAFYVGLQSFEAHEVLQDIDPNFTLEEVGYIANWIQRIVNQNVARKSQARPAWEVLPNSPDIDDQEGAKAGQSLLDYAFDHCQVKKKHRAGLYWLELTGNYFWYADWDSKAGKKHRVYYDPFSEKPYGQGQLNQDQKVFLDRVGSVSDKNEGDWFLDVMGPFQVRAPHRYEFLADMPWVVIERYVSMQKLWDMFGKAAAEVPPEEIGTTEDNQYWRRLSSLVARHGFTLPSRGGNDYEGVTLRELWIPPCEQFPNGFLVQGTKSKLLKNDEHPFKKAGLDIRFPITHVGNMKVPGRFWHMGTVEHLLGAQREYNISRDQLRQHRDIISHPQLLSHRGNKVTTFRNEIGDVWQWEGQHKPEWLQAPALSQAHMATVDQAKHDMQMLAAQSDVTQAQVPQGVRSGVAIRALQEKDLQVIGPSIEETEEGFAELGTRLLQLGARHMSIPRAIQIHGETRQADVIFLRGGDLNGNTTVRVRPGSMMPKSRSEALQIAMDMVQIGALDPTNPKHGRYIIKLVEDGDLNKLFQEEDADRRRARIENQMFLRPGGDPAFAFPDVKDYDDHQAHVEEHYLFMKTDAFERLPVMRKLAIEAHVDKHLQAVGRMIEAQTAFQQTASGGGPGGGSQPKEPGEASQPRERQPTPGSEKAGS